MRIVAFVTQKGGSGKSALASSLAVTAQETGEKVCVIDMDPHASLMSWSKARAADDIAVVASGAAGLPSVLAQMKAKGCTLAVIDTPDADGPASAAAMAAAHLNIIPSRPSMFDLWASAKTCAALTEIGGDFVFLLNQCPSAAKTARVKDGIEALNEMGGLVSPLIPTRGDYPEAARRGAGVTELDPNGPAADEMRSLWGSIRRRLSRARQNSAPLDAA